MESPHSITEEEEKESMIANYGFSATLTARPGMGDQLVDLLLT